MNKRIPVLTAVMLMLLWGRVIAQDPNFAQFFASPLNINPALTAHTNSNWRAVAHIRDEWISSAIPYVTGTMSYDSKIYRKTAGGTQEENNFGIGGMMMFDRAIAGAVKSNYASMNLSYKIPLSDGDWKQELGSGVGLIYGSRRVSFGDLTFEEQFTGNGFNSSLPTGEKSLSNMKPYFSVSAGFTYSLSSANSNFDIGIASFHLNKPQQTFLEDEHTYLKRRDVLHANYESFLTDQLILNLNGIYQKQARANYFSIGGALGYYLDNSSEVILTGGLWYWSRKSIIPYLGINYHNFEFGFSYDVNTSAKYRSATRQNSWEVSVVIRGEKLADYIPCPWK